MHVDLLLLGQCREVGLLYGTETGRIVLQVLTGINVRQQVLGRRWLNRQELEVFLGLRRLLLGLRLLAVVDLELIDELRDRHSVIEQRLVLRRVRLFLPEHILLLALFLTGHPLHPPDIDHVLSVLHNVLDLPIHFLIVHMFPQQRLLDLYPLVRVHRRQIRCHLQWLQLHFVLLSFGSQADSLRHWVFHYAVLAGLQNLSITRWQSLLVLVIPDQLLKFL